MTEHQNKQVRTDDKQQSDRVEAEENLQATHTSNALLAASDANPSNHATQSLVIRRNFDHLSPHTIFRLQSVIGNQAIQRLLARHPNRRASHIQRQEGDSRRGPQRVERVYQQQDVNIRTIEGPVLRPRGEYQWRVAYSLPQPANEDGYIIQKLTMTCEDLITGNVGSLTFYETWFVRRGDTQPERDRAYDDTYGTYNMPAATPTEHGRNTHIGIAKFYEGPLPSQFGTPVPGMTHYNTPEVPDGWNNTGTRHDMIAEWDVRPGHEPYNRLRAYAGEQLVPYRDET